MSDLDSTNASSEPKRHSFKSLLAEPKGKIEYSKGEAFLLHVFWQAPTIQAAEEILTALTKMAAATMRDTPCVVCYFFRLSRQDFDLCAPIQKVSDNIHIKSIFRKKKAGVPPSAIAADLRRLGYDDSIQDLSPSDDLPTNLQSQPVMLEFTEVYLDERCFMEHAGSRDYLDNHAVLMKPLLHSAVPTTIRMGTPSSNLIEKILEPILKESVVAMTPGDIIWRERSTPSITIRGGSDEAANSTETAIATAASAFNTPFIVSLDASSAAIEKWSQISGPFKELCTTCVSFPHPLRIASGDDSYRLLAILPGLPSQLSILESLKCLNPVRIEVYVQRLPGLEGTENESFESIKDAFKCLETQISFHLLESPLESSTGNQIVTSNIESAGYVLHPRSSVVKPI